MVSVTSNVPEGVLVDSQDLQAWLASLSGNWSKSEFEKLKQACNIALEIPQQDENGSGESRLKRAVSVADILAEMGLDWETMTATILYHVLPGGREEHSSLELQFGEGVGRIVDDLRRISSLTLVSSSRKQESGDQHIENLRRMMLSIVGDIRVVLVVLAERLHEMRLLKHQPDEIQRSVAHETELIYGPLANRLGIWQIKWELEDLSLRYLRPDEYRDIANRLGGSRADRESFISLVIGQLQARFSEAGIKAEVFGRPKHIYSIWRKMHHKNVGFDQIFDLRALRVMVDTVADCYAALGAVHSIWRHIPGEFDDYIATPKANLYRSIHTAVIGPEDKTLEIQIRTHEMHQHAELGVAAHWRYKEPGKQDEEFERRVMLMRNWLEVKDDPAGSEEFIETLKSDFEPQQVYVLTPQGRVIELSSGSTAVDFAYAVHSDVGHRCRGARVDGRIAPLTQPLRSGQSVEILTVKEGGPSRDWLSPHLGYTKTGKARNRIRHWFKHQDYEANLNSGRNSLEREIARLAVSRPDLESAAYRFNFKKADDLLAAIGRGEVSPIQVAGMGSGPKESAPSEPEQIVRKRARTGPAKAKGTGSGDIIVAGVDDLMTHMAGCCKPVPGDEIIGFITRGRGVTVHRCDCAAIKGLKEEERPRLVEVVWADRQTETTYSVDIRVLASDRKGLLRDISSILTNEEVDVLGVSTYSDRKTDRASMRFTIEIADMRQLSRLLDKISQLPDVMEVHRQA